MSGWSENAIQIHQYYIMALKSFLQINSKILEVILIKCQVSAT